MSFSLKRNPDKSGTPHNHWDDEDWQVLVDGEVEGRIIQRPDTKAWHWQLAYRHRHVGAEPFEGYAVDRAGAQDAFKAAWERRRKFETAPLAKGI